MTIFIVSFADEDLTASRTAHYLNEPFWDGVYLLSSSSSSMATMGRQMAPSRFVERRLGRVFRVVARVVAFMGGDQLLLYNDDEFLWESLDNG